jgi:PAS domain S-box-containing protein
MVLQKLDDQIGESARVDPEVGGSALELQKISTLLIQESNVTALYERILDAAINLSLQVFSLERNELRLLASKGFHSESSAFWEDVRVESASSCGLALSSGARIIVPDVEACDFMAGTGDLDAYRRSGIRAVQSTPLISRSGQLLGMISTHWREPHQPTERDLQPFDVLARQAADLIERARAEAALRESEQQARWFAAIVESSDDAIISKDLDGTITSWNKGAERIFGYLAEEIIGKPLLILIPPDRHDEETTILERIRRGERIDHYETVRKTKHGSLIDISLTVSPPLGTFTAKSSARRKLFAILPSANGAKRKSPFSRAKPSTVPRTCWRPYWRRCTSQAPTRPTASSVQSRDASRRWQTRTVCSWNRVGPEPSYTGSLRRNYRHIARKETDGRGLTART